MDERSRQKRAAGRLIAAASERLGGRQELSDWLRPWYEIGYSGVGHWIRGRSDAPAWILFLIAEHLDLSLDGFLSRPSYSFEKRLAILEETMSQVVLTLRLTESAEATDSTLTTNEPGR